MSLRKYKTSKSNSVTWKYQKGGLVQYGGGGFNWEGIEGAGNIKGGLGIAGMAGGALQAAGGQDSFAAQGLGGAASGAAAGMMLGPLGAIVGGAIGGGIGLLKAGAANKQQDAQERAQMQQRQGMIRMQQQSDATENPYAATFAYGGRVPGYDPMTGNIPELAVYGKRPVQQMMPRTPSIYTPQGGGNWSYNGGADQWFNTVERDKKGNPSYMSPENYEKKYPKQLRQAGYRELYGKGGQVPPKGKKQKIGKNIQVLPKTKQEKLDSVYNEMDILYSSPEYQKYDSTFNSLQNKYWALDDSILNYNSGFYKDGILINADDNKVNKFKELKRSTEGERYDSTKNMPGKIKFDRLSEEIDNIKNSKYPQGGMIPQGMPNAELEKEEVTQGPDGSMQKMNMPSHQNATGKNQIALEPGTRIYSDKLKPKGEKKTYAQLADELRKQLEKYEQNLQA